MRRAPLCRVLAACAGWAAIVALGDLSSVQGAERSESANAAQTAAGTGSQEAESAATLYRRIYVPVENVEAWPRGGEKFLPVEQHEFEALLKSANRAASERPGTATIEDAHYSARFDGERLDDCRGEWHIAVRGTAPAFLALGDTSLLLREARWRGEITQPVRIGAWGRNGGTVDTLGLEVPKSGVLEFDWQVPSKSIHNGTEFAWRLPAATAARLVLDLPQGKEPLVDGGVVLARRPLPRQLGSEGTDHTRWELAVDSSLVSTVRIVNVAGPPPNAMPTLTFREEVRYDITRRGLDLEATWRLDDVERERRELAVPLPKDVYFVSAVFDNRELPWRIENDDRAGEKVAVIELPETISREAVRIRVRAWQPPLLDELWHLPALRPRSVYWQSGTAELAISPQLEMQALKPADCRPTSVNRPVDGAEEPEIIALSKYSPDAEVSVRIARRRPRAAVRLGSSLALADPDINGQLVSEWQVSQGSLHQLSGQLAPGWVIEAVEATPPEALGEWFIDQRENGRHLEIQLARPARPGRKVTVTLSGRLQRVALGDPIRTETMRMVDWADATVAQHLFAFQTVEPYAVESTGALPVVSAEALSGDDLARVNLPSGKETIFDLTRASDAASLTLTMEPGQYVADIRVIATFHRKEISQQFHLSIDPASNGIDRLLIYSTAPLGDGVRWTETSLKVPLTAERLPADDPRLAGLPGGGELWLVRLPGLTTRRVELTASVATPRSERQRLPLLAMPEAVEQRGLAVLHAEMANMPLLEPRGLQLGALPVDYVGIDNRDGLPPARAAYRYDPAACLSPANAAQLSMERSSANDSHPLIARRVELESYFWSNGRATHRATYDLENNGAASFDLMLPEGAVITAISLDGQALDSPVGDRSQGRSKIPLPPAIRSANATIHFETRNEPLAAGRELQPPLVHQEIPLLNGHWTIWLPDEYSITGGGEAAAGRGLNWRRRLFGPLGRHSEKSPFQPVNSADWAQLLSPLGSLSAPASAAQSGHLLGWNAYRTSFVAEGPAGISVTHLPVMTAWGIATFLVCLVCGRWLQGRGTVLIVLLSLAAILAIVLPGGQAFIATGAVLGLAASIVARWISSPPSRAGIAADSWSRIARVSAPAVAFALIAASLAVAEPAAGPAASPNGAGDTAIERVLIPIDSDGRLAGSKIYLSEGFLRALMRPPDDAVQATRQWILLDATYSGELRERVKPAGIVAGEWSLLFDIEVLARDTAVVLPLVRREAAWQDTAILDGVPVPLRWDAEGNSCMVEISEPGRYTLTVTCVPRSAPDGRRNSVKLTIPPLPGARLRLEYPKSIAGLIGSGINFATETEESPGRLERQLDATGTLEVGWPPIAWTAGSAQSLRVTGMRWLRIGKDEVRLALKYVFEGGARRPEALVVAFDRRWELMVDDGLPAAVEEPDGRRSVRVPLPPDDLERHVVTLEWRLPRANTFGHMRLPAMELLSAPVTNRWLAISTDVGVECEVIDGSGSPGSVSEFLGMWGDAADVPQLVLGNIQQVAAWNLAVRPRQSESTIDEMLHVAAGRGGLRVAYQADVTPGTAHQYQFPLNVPEHLAIDEVVLSSGGQRVPLRWARVGDLQLNVFFSEQLTSDYRLTLRGTAPADDGAPRSLPRVTATAKDATAQDVQLYREEDVLVELRGLSKGSRPLEGPRELPPPTWNVRPLGAYRLDKTAFDEARVRIRNNDVHLAGPMLISIDRETDAWSASFTARLTVEKGRLDTLKLHAPAAWAGPFSIESSVPAAMELDAANRRAPTLSVRFAESIEKGDSIDLTVRGVLANTIPATIAVPNITAEPTVQGKRYLQVPSQWNGQPIAWTTEGTQPARLPKELRDASGAFRSGQTLEVSQAAFRVAVQPHAVPRQPARVRLAETIVWAAAAEAQLIETRLVIAVPDLDQCLVQLPPEQKLVSVHLGGERAIIHRLDERHWRVNVGPTPFPQMLEIVSVARRAEQATATLRRPRLLAAGEPIPEELSLWSIGYASAAERPSVAGAAAVTEAFHAATLLDRLVSIAESATPIALESAARDGHRWFAAWAGRLTSLRQEAVEIMDRAPEQRSPSQIARPAEDQLNRVSERLERWIEQGQELLAEPDENRPPAADLRARLARETETLPGSRWIYCVAEGGTDELALDLPPVSASARRVRVLGVSAILCAAATSFWLLRRPAATDVLYRWPHAVAFLAGIAFWAWLWPSWVGMGIAAASLLLAWRPGWPGRSLPLERSTVLRLPRSDTAGS